MAENQTTSDAETIQVNAINPEFRNAINNFLVTKIPSQVAQEALKAWDRTLTNENRIALNTDERSELDMDNAHFVATGWGGVLIIKPNRPTDNELAIIYDGKTQEIAGYGTMKTENGIAEITGRIFQQNSQKFRERGVKPRKVIQDRIWAQIALHQNDIQSLVIPPKQLYNPSVSGYESPAVPAYWRMGFRTDSEQEQKVIKEFELGHTIDNQTLILIAQHPMHLDLGAYDIKHTKAETELKPIPEQYHQRLHKMLISTPTPTTPTTTSDKLSKLAARIQKI